LGVGEVAADGAGRFVRATLRPQLEVAPGTDVVAAAAIHHEVHKYCFIARSVNFPIDYLPSFIEQPANDA
jgi:organic hydroperoxide reductase OsmC/OhrA